MLSYAYLSSSSPPSSGGIIILLCSYLNETYNKNFGNNCCTAYPSIDNLRQSVAIGYCRTWVWCRIHFQISFLTHSLIFVWQKHFGILDNKIRPAMISFRFDSAAHNRQKSVFDLTYNGSENWRSNLLVIGCFTGSYGTYDIGMLSLNTSGVVTMADSIIFLVLLMIIIFANQFVYLLCFQDI